MPLKLFDRIDSWLDVRKHRRTLAYLRELASAVRGRTHEIATLTPPEISRSSLRLQKILATKRHPEATEIVEAFALASLAVKHVLRFYPNDTQIAAAVLLAEGNIVEMRSGEGKTVVALLAAYWQVLMRRHVDIATTNDYLAERDHHAMGLAYSFLGASVGLVISSTPRAVRRDEYRKHITYVSNQELGFDYLRDNLAMEPGDQVSGTHDFVIIDEVDSILIDEARTALIITEPSREAALTGRTDVVEIQRLFKIIQGLTPQTDYTVDYRLRSVALTDHGVERVIAQLGKDLYRAKDIQTMRALWYALYVWVFIRPDEDFIVKNGKVVLVDEFTGHPMPDRVLFEGLQEAVEARAGVRPSGEFAITASITYRNFFKLYRGIGGMTGTAFDAREEFYNLYRLPVLAFGPHQGLLRRDLPAVFFRLDQEKFQAVAREAERARREEAPLLIVGRSIATAKAMSKRLAEHGIPHQLLHAAVSQAEAHIIDEAGKPGVVTIATNMAGRGADIIIAESVRTQSGLRVLGIEHNLSRRVDEQLRGRSGRQGQFGETKIFASLEDELFQVYADNAFWDRAEKIEWPADGLSDEVLAAGVARAQEEAQQVEAELRVSLARFDSMIDRHRSATYALRSHLVSAENYWEILLAEAHRILLKEKSSAMATADLTKLLEWEKLTPQARDTIQRFVTGAGAAPTPSRTDTRAEPVYIQGRKTLLTLLDQSWQRYLESVHWLEDWISLTSVAHEDPYVQFAETADRMFHAMRREFAVGALKAIIAIPA